MNFLTSMWEKNVQVFSELTLYLALKYQSKPDVNSCMQHFHFYNIISAYTWIQGVVFTITVTWINNDKSILPPCQICVLAISNHFSFKAQSRLVLKKIYLSVVTQFSINFKLGYLFLFSSSLQRKLSVSDLSEQFVFNKSNKSYDYLLNNHVIKIKIKIIINLHILLKILFVIVSHVSVKF